ncbi:hypothetical protein [Microcystis sp. LEGE 08355]|uniref:hypothetical protein n=1 Tax=Microcystis sp. LEGE 08355 TaxID=1828687 RepID=UPI0018813CDA|nr:hypothetical protein [Microcystis sp. LEGE 08355]MBE9074396.1 hypothetical protein [Microcystis sp. LEGE 08355]
MQQDYAIGTIEWQDVERPLTSWMAHLEHGDTWQLRKQIFDSVLLSLLAHPILFLEQGEEK